jgi:hypothetical protein
LREGSVCFKIEGEGSVITPSFKGGGLFYPNIFEENVGDA